MHGCSSMPTVSSLKTGYKQILSLIWLGNWGRGYSGQADNENNILIANSPIPFSVKFWKKNLIDRVEELKICVCVVCQSKSDQEKKIFKKHTLPPPLKLNGC